MPNIKDASTVEAIAREYCNNGRCKGDALVTVGYSKTYAKQGGRGTDVVFHNVRIIAAIAKIDARAVKKMDHNRDIAIAKLTADYDNLAKQAKNGNIQAIQARTAIVRELNAISNLHSSTLVQAKQEPVIIPDAERAEVKRLAGEFLKLRRVGDTA